jgi:hypothetical protein
MSSDENAPEGISPERWDKRFTWHEGDTIGFSIPGRREIFEDLYLKKITEEEAAQRLVKIGWFGGSIETARQSAKGQAAAWVTSIPVIIGALREGTQTPDEALKALLGMCVERSEAKRMVEENTPRKD